MFGEKEKNSRKTLCKYQRPGGERCFFECVPGTKRSINRRGKDVHESCILKLPHKHTPVNALIHSQTFRHKCGIRTERRSHDPPRSDPRYLSASCLPPKLPGSHLPVLISLSLRHALPPSVNETLPIAQSLLLSLFYVCLLRSNLSSDFFFLFGVFQGPGCFAAMPRCLFLSVHLRYGKSKLPPVCSRLVVTPLGFWVCMEGGTERERQGGRKEKVGNFSPHPSSSLPPSLLPS